MDDTEQFLASCDKEHYFLVGTLISLWNDTEIALRYVLEGLTSLHTDPKLAIALLRHIGNRSLLDTIEDLAIERETDLEIRSFIISLCRFAEACRVNRNHIAHARLPFEWEHDIDALVIEPDQRVARQRYFVATKSQIKTCIADTRRCFEQALNLFYFFYFRGDETEADEYRQRFDLGLAPPALLLSNPQNLQ